MSSILRWIVGVGFLWLVVTLGLTAYVARFEVSPQGPTSPADAVVYNMSKSVLEWGQQLGHFIAPIVQIALIVMILIAAAERFGFTEEKRLWGGFEALGAANNVQAFIAVTVIGALVIGVLGGVEKVDALKDLALVVVGFYFGTRRKQGDVEDAVAAGIASASQPPAAPAPNPDQNPPQPPR